MVEPSSSKEGEVVGLFIRVLESFEMVQHIGLLWREREGLK